MLTRNRGWGTFGDALRCAAEEENHEIRRVALLKNGAIGQEDVALVGAAEEVEECVRRVLEKAKIPAQGPACARHS